MLIFHCERLYTNLDQADLKQRLLHFLERVLQAHAQYPLVAISSQGVARWQTGDLPAGRRFVYTQGRQHYLMDLAAAQNLPELLIKYGCMHM